MNIKYKILFEIELLHDYYINRVSKDFAIVPSTETAKILRGHGMLYKMVGNKMLALIKVDGTVGDLPFVPMNPETRLSFYLLPDVGGFLNYTLLDYLPSQSQRYFLHNLNQTLSGPTKYLNHRVPDYNAGNNYPVGSLSSTPGGEIFEAIRSSNSGSPHGLGENNFWVSKGETQYVNNADLVELTTTNYNFKLVLPDTNITTRIFGLNILTGIYDVQVKATVVKTFESPQSNVAVNLNDITPGKYRVQVNTESHDVYVDNTAVYKNVLGIIEVFNHLPAANPFSLFNGDGTSKENTFSIRFANRSIIWKYTTRTTDITGVSDVDYSFSSPATKTFTSDKPIPLSEKAREVSGQSTSLGSIKLPSAGTNRLQQIVQGSDNYLCSEIFLII